MSSSCLALKATIPFIEAVEDAAGGLSLPIEGESIGTRRCSGGLDDELNYAQWMLGDRIYRACLGLTVYVPR